MTRDVLVWPFEPDKTVVDGRFRVKGVVGEGGMGRIYRVEDIDLFDRVCVLKMLTPKLHPSQVPQHDARALLINEVQILSKLSEGSDSFVTVFGRGTAYVAIPIRGEAQTRVELDLPYYVMELLQGTNLEKVIERNKRETQFLPWTLVVELCTQAAHALSVAHAKDVVHRDIKPNNLFLHERVDRKAVVKCIDFGVSTRHGAPGVLGSGTKRYGAPELLQPGAPPFEDKQSDIYPLGLIMYELATLIHPLIEHKDNYARAHICETPTPLRARRADGAPPGFEKLVDACLAKKPGDRPTAKEITRRLNAIRSAMGYEDEEMDAELANLLSSMRDHSSRRRKEREATAMQQAVTAVRSVRNENPPPESEVFLKHSVPSRAAPTKPAAVQIAGGPILDATIVDPPSFPVQEAAPTPRQGIVRAAFVNDTVRDAQPLFFLDAPTSEKTAPIPKLVDEEKVPVFSSMAGVFEGMEETTHQSSVFDAGHSAEQPPADQPSDTPPAAEGKPTFASVTVAPEVAGDDAVSRRAEPTVEGPVTREYRKRARRALLGYIALGISIAGFFAAVGILAMSIFYTPSRPPPLAPSVPLEPAASSPTSPAPSALPELGGDTGAPAVSTSASASPPPPFPEDHGLKATISR